jgi:hypothetical protein
MENQKLENTYWNFDVVMTLDDERIRITDRVNKLIIPHEYHIIIDPRRGSISNSVTFAMASSCMFWTAHEVMLLLIIDNNLHSYP